MKNEQIQECMHENLKHFDIMRKKVLNDPACNIANSLEHEIVRLIVRYKLKQYHKRFISEGYLKNGKIPDETVLDSDPMIHYEVMYTETDKGCDMKRSEYPGVIMKIRVPKELRSIAQRIYDNINI